MLGDSPLIDDFSFSKLSTFSKCARKAFFRYVLQLKDVMPFFNRGTAVHFGQEWDNKEKVRGYRPRVEQVLDAATFRLIELEKLGKTSVKVDTFVDEHRVQLVKYNESGFRDKVKPMAGTIEAPFQIEVALGGEEKPARIGGFVDCVSQVEEGEDSRVVVDYKSGQRVTEVKGVQFDLYRIGAEAPKVTVVSFIAGERQRPGTKVKGPVAATEVERAQTRRWIFEQVRAFRHAVKTGDWPMCAPESYWCAASACSYYGRCYPEKAGPSAPFAEIVKVARAGTLPIPEWKARKDGAYVARTEPPGLDPAEGGARGGGQEDLRTKDHADDEHAKSAGGGVQSRSDQGALEGGSGGGDAGDGGGEGE